MHEQKRFVKKFSGKANLELENYIENPALYEPLAVEAAKWLLENKDFSEKNTQNIEETIVQEPQLVEKAFFKNKMLSTQGEQLVGHLNLVGLKLSQIYIFQVFKN